LQQVGRPGLGIFSIAPIGLSITVAGILFTLFIGRYLLPAREGTSDAGHRFRMDRYFTELTILANSPFVKKKANITLLSWVGCGTSNLYRIPWASGV
jgi:hypothetical protein